MSQVLLRCARTNHRVVLLFKDSKSGTAELCGTRFSNDLEKHAQMKKQTQYPDHAWGFAPQRKLGPAISEAAEPAGATPSAAYLPFTSRWSEARPR
jgi:hypothetical protein